MIAKFKNFWANVKKVDKVLNIFDKFCVKFVESTENEMTFAKNWENIRKFEKIEKTVIKFWWDFTGKILKTFELREKNFTKY